MAQSKVWIYQSDKDLNAEEIRGIKEDVNSFLANWHAHGKPLDAGFDILHGLFLVLKVDEVQAEASGCSIDKSVALFKEIGQKYGIELFDWHQFAYEYGGKVYNGHLGDLDQLVSEGYITDDTMVYDNLVRNIKDYEQKFRVPFKQSWHKRMLSSSVTASI